MKKHVSQALRRKVMADRIKESVCVILHISEQDYCDKQYAGALSYLREVIGDVYMEDQFQRSKMFWKWWLNEWHLRDELFLSKAQIGNYSVNPDGQMNYTPVTYGPAYNYEHNACRLAADAGMQNSYNNMMQLVIDEQNSMPYAK